MSDHKFKVGQRVKLSPARYGSNRHPHYDVVQLMPAESAENRYTVKSVWDKHECVVRESELS